jgi:hypothetical protein
MAGIVTRPVWQLILAIYLILVCINAFVGLGSAAIIVPILAGLAGVLMLVGK